MKLVSLKVDTAALAARVREVIADEAAAYERALAGHDAAVAQWAKATAKTLRKAADDIEAGRPALTKWGDLKASIDPKPAKPSAPDKTRHTKILRLLEMSSQDTISVSTDSELGRYL